MIDRERPRIVDHGALGGIVDGEAMIAAHPRNRGEIDDRAKLIVMTPEKFWERSRVHAHVNHEVRSIKIATSSSVSLISVTRVGLPASATPSICTSSVLPTRI